MIENNVTYKRAKKKGIIELQLSSNTKKKESMSNVDERIIGFIHKDASIAKGVRIGKFVSIHANTRIGKNTVIEDGARIYEDCTVGRKSIIGPNAVLRPRTRIGDNTIFGSLSVSEGDNSIGNFTTVHAQCHITKKVTIGNCCFIAPFFIASNTPNITSRKHGTSKKIPDLLSTVIRDYVRIGINVSMIPGCSIGEHSLIYQNCLITKDILPYSIVKGGKDKVGRIIGKVSNK